MVSIGRQSGQICSLDTAVALTHHQVGEPDTATVAAAGGVVHATVVVVSMLALRRLLCCVHPEDNAVKLELVVSTVETLRAHTEAVAQAVQLPHPTWRPAVQREHQVPGDRVVTDP